MLWHKIQGAGGNVGGGGIEITEFAYLDSAGSTNNQTTYTHNVSFGTADSDRWILVGYIAYGNNNETTISSVTIGGVSATILRQKFRTGASSVSALAIANVPTGTSGDIVVTNSAAKSGSRAYAYRLVTTGTPSEYDGFSIQDAETSTLDISSNSVTVGVGGTFNGTNHTWTNLTENEDSRIGSEAMQTTTASGTPSAQSSYSVTCDETGASLTTQIFLCTNIIAT